VIVKLPVANPEHGPAVGKWRPGKT
jgi:hypothetical protein